MPKEKNKTRNLEQKVDDILDVVGFLKDNMASKDDLRALETRLELRMDKRFDEMDVRFKKVDARFDEMDRKFLQIDARFNEMDVRFSQISTELAAIRADLDDVKNKLASLDKRATEDTNALSSDILMLTARVEKIEKRIKQLEKA